MWSGRFNDGRTAASHPVRVEVSLYGVDIRDMDNRLLARWDPASLSVTPPPAPGEPVRLTSTIQPDARLAVADATFLGALQRVRPPPRPWSHRLAVPLLVAASVALLAGLYVSLPALARPLARMMPAEWERDWGGAVAEELAGGSEAACTGAAGRVALEDLAGRLARGMGLDHPVTLHVSREPVMNALAAPGGHVVLYGKFLDSLEGPDELAAVLAHELAHAHHRHATAQLIRGAGLAGIVALVTGDMSGTAAAVVIAVTQMSYSRSDEAEADRTALETLAGLNHATTGLATFFERLAETEDELPFFLSTHPPSLDRAEVARTLTGGSVPPLSPEQWLAVKGMCAA